MRVVHCIYDDPENPWVAGGGAVRVREIYRRLAPRLESVEVLTGNFPGASDMTLEGVTYRRLGARTPYAWSRVTYSVLASRWLRRKRYDAAVFDFSTYTPLLLPADRPIGITVHHVTGANAADRWGRFGGGLMAAQEKARLRRGRVFSATSRETERQLRDLVGSRAQILSIKAGVDDALFSQPRADRGYLLYFGRLDWHHKGLDVLVAAMRRISAARPEVRLRIAGRGKDIGRLREAVRNAGLGDVVDLIGPVEDAVRDELLAGASLLLMPSRFEGFGMVAAEAMAAGVPVVASDAGSLPEVVDPPHGGVLFPSGDAAALASRVLELLADDARRAEFGVDARRSAERFRWDRVAEQHLEFLQRISKLDAGRSERQEG